MRIVSVLLAVVLATRPASGQEPPTRSLMVPPTWQAPAQLDHDSTGWTSVRPSIVAPVVGGVGGGLMGMFVLGLAGYHLGGGGEICGDDPCGLAGGLYGAMFGELIGVATGVHIANGRRGSFGTDLCASLLTLIVASAAFSGENSDVAVPITLIAQLGATVAAERLTAGRRRRTK